MLEIAVPAQRSAGGKEMNRFGKSRETRNTTRFGVFSVVTLIAALLVGCSGEERSDAVSRKKYRRTFLY